MPLPNPADNALAVQPDGALAVDNTNQQSPVQNLAEGMVATLNMHTKLLIGANILLGSIADGITTMKDAITDSFKGSNLDSGTVQGNIVKKNDDDLAGKFGSMLDSMEEAFGNMSATKKSMLGIAALLAGLAILNAFSDELVEKLAPILKFIKEKLIPGLQELNAIILDAPGGYWTLLSGIGLSTLLWNFFGVNGKIAGLFAKVTSAITNIKITTLFDDLALRAGTWGTRIRTAFTGRMTGLFGRIGGVFSAIGFHIRNMKIATLFDDLALRAGTWGSRIRTAFGGRMIGLFARIGNLFTSIGTTIRNSKLATVLDDLILRAATWGSRIRLAFAGGGGPHATGLFSRISGIFTSIGTSIRAMGLTVIDDLAVALKNLTPTWAKVLKLRVLGGSTIYPIVKGGGKTIGLVGRVSQSVESISTAIKNMNPFKGLAASLKTLGTSWRLALSGTIFGVAGGPAGAGKSVGLIGKAGTAVGSVANSISSLNPFKGLGTTLKTLGASWRLALSSALFGAQTTGSVGAAATVGSKAGVLGAITNAITRIAVIIKSIFSPASILGRFTSKIKTIFGIIGKALGFVSRMSGLTHFLKLGLSLGKAIPVVGQIILVLVGIFSFIKGAIEGFKTGGIMGAITGGLIGLYDGLVGSFLNLIFDLIGWIFKKLGFERVGEYLGNLDFNFDSIMSGIGWVWDNIKRVFHNLVNGLKKTANFFIRIANLKPWGEKQPLYDTSPYVSTWKPLAKETAKVKEDIPAVPTAAVVANERLSQETIDIAQIKSNLMSELESGAITEEEAEAQLSAHFSTIDQGLSIEHLEKSKAIIEDMNREPTQAEIDANTLLEEKDRKEGERIAEEMMRKNDLEYQAEVARDGGAVVYHDTSTRSTLNNTTQVSNALSVDASDLVAAKLNLMLPAFN